MSLRKGLFTTNGQVNLYRRVCWMDAEGRRCADYVRLWRSAKAIRRRADFDRWWVYNDGTRSLPQATRAARIAQAVWQRISRHERLA